MALECRLGCAACCIAPSISSPIVGMPNCKPAGMRCIQLDERDLCRLFGDSRRPRVCGGLQASFEMCGETREQAMVFLARLERETMPSEVNV